MGQGINSTDKATSGGSKTTLLRTIDTRGVSRDVLVTLVGSGVIHPESHHPAGTAAKSYHPKYAGRWPTPAQRFSRGPRSGAPALRRVVAAS